MLKCFVTTFIYIANILFLDQRNLGMSMRIERSTLDQVKQRFELNKQKKSEQKKKYDLDKRLQELQEEVKYLMYSIDIHKFKCKYTYYYFNLSLYIFQ